MIDLENSTRIYFSIKEVASHFGVNESLLRFWEKEFEEISPRKTNTGVRQYSKDDIKKIAVVYSLVKEKGLTLEGARQTLKVKKDEETRRVELIQKLESIKNELEELRNQFDNL